MCCHFRTADLPATVRHIGFSSLPSSIWPILHDGESIRGGRITSGLQIFMTTMWLFRRFEREGWGCSLHFGLSFCICSAHFVQIVTRPPYWPTEPLFDMFLLLINDLMLLWASSEFKKTCFHLALIFTQRVLWLISNVRRSFWASCRLSMTWTSLTSIPSSSLSACFKLPLRLELTSSSFLHWQSHLEVALSPSSFQWVLDSELYKLFRGVLVDEVPTSNFNVTDIVKLNGDPSAMRQDRRWQQRRPSPVNILARQPAWGVHAPCKSKLPHLVFACLHTQHEHTLKHKPISWSSISHNLRHCQFARVNIAFPFRHGWKALFTDVNIVNDNVNVIILKKVVRQLLKSNTIINKISISLI